MYFEGQKVEVGQVWQGTDDIYLICSNGREPVVVLLGATGEEPFVLDALTINVALAGCHLLFNSPKKIIKRSVKALLKGEE